MQNFVTSIFFMRTSRRDKRGALIPRRSTGELNVPDRDERNEDRLERHIRVFCLAYPPRRRIYISGFSLGEAFLLDLNKY